MKYPIFYKTKNLNTHTTNYSFIMRLLLPSLLLSSTCSAFLSPPRSPTKTSLTMAAGGPLSVRPIGIGSASPSTTITNFDLESVHDTSDEWIRTRTGIESRKVLVHEGTRKVVKEGKEGELDDVEEKETLRTLGVDGECLCVRLGGRM
jgi:hypothetical protein